jgi:hypothetical protein
MTLFVCQHTVFDICDFMCRLGLNLASTNINKTTLCLSGRLTQANVEGTIELEVPFNQRGLFNGKLQALVVRHGTGSPWPSTVDACTAKALHVRRGEWHTAGVSPASAAQPWLNNTVAKTAGIVYTKDHYVVKQLARRLFLERVGEDRHFFGRP